MRVKLICTMLLIATLLAACAGSASPTEVSEGSSRSREALPTQAGARERSPGQTPATTHSEADTTVLRFAIYDKQRS